MAIMESACTKRGCKHYLGIWRPESEGEGDYGETHTCAAYPKGIPDDIDTGKDKHLKVRPDQDNEIVYEKGKNIFEREGE